MFRKIIITVLTFTLIVGSSVCSFATNGEYLNQADNTAPILRYASIMDTCVGLEFNGSAANVVAMASPKSNTNLDYIKMTVKLMKTESGTATATWNETVYISDGKFTFSSSKKVTARGTYYVAATMKCYKNNKLVETITLQGTNVKY